MNRTRFFWFIGLAEYRFDRNKDKFPLLPIPILRRCLDMIGLGLFRVNWLKCKIKMQRYKLGKESILQTKLKLPEEKWFC